MKAETQAKLLQAYRYAITATQDGIAELLEDVILDEMSKEEPTWKVARRIDAVTLDKGSHGNLSAIASAIYEPEFGWTSGACAMLRDKLVRLLGGAHERDCRGGRDDTGASRADNSDGEQAEEVNLLSGDEPSFTEIAKTINLGDESDSELMENGENHKIATITDELRVWAHGLSDPWKRNVEAPLLAIADRIDEQFDRICEQHEAVLQSTIEQMADENLTVKDERDYWKREAVELQAKLDKIAGVLDGRD